MFLRVASAVLCVFVALTLAEARVQHRGLAANGAAVSPSHPYLFLSVPRGRSGAIVQGYEVIEENDDDDNDVEYDDDHEARDDDHDDDDHDDDAIMQKKSNSIAFDDVDEDDEDEDNDDDDDDADDQHNNNVAAVKPGMQIIVKNAKATHMMVPRDQAGAIMVPDGVIEIEGQSVIDEKTGKAALLVPRAALDAIPDGSVVALMERSVDGESEEERANRVFVRRRRKGSRRNVKRRGGKRRRRAGGRRRANKRKGVRVYNTGGKRRRGVKRGGRRPAYFQG